MLTNVRASEKSVTYIPGNTTNAFHEDVLQILKIFATLPFRCCVTEKTKVKFLKLGQPFCNIENVNLVCFFTYAIVM